MCASHRRWTRGEHRARAGLPVARLAGGLRPSRPRGLKGGEAGRSAGSSRVTGRGRACECRGSGKPRGDRRRRSNPGRSSSVSGPDRKWPRLRNFRFYDAGMLLGRAAECGRLDELLSQSRRRVSGALAICGEPGLGKTALLSYACDRAADMLVLTARAVESESEIPYAALADLLRPIVPLLSRIPAPQAAALAGSLATGPPVRGDRFAVAAATLSLLAAAADDTPVLCVVDDAQWMDESSAEAPVLAARRLRAEGVLVLLGLRSGDRGADRFGAIDCLQVTPLDERAAFELVTRAAGRGLRPSLLAALVAGAGGNPLALLELPASLTPGQRAGREPLPTPLRIGSALERAFGGRVGEMPAATRRALL